MKERVLLVQHRSISGVAFLVVSLCLVAGAAQADFIPVITHSSDVSVDPSLLDAEFGLGSIVLDKADEGKNKKEWLLKLTVVNSTSADEGFDIDQIYFSSTLGPLDVTKVEVKGIAGGGDKRRWALAFDHENISGDRFGLFDFKLSSKEPHREFIAPQQTVEFTLKIKTVFAVSLTNDDFAVESVQPDGGDDNTLAFGVGHFLRGGVTDELSAYGAYVHAPEPASMSLLALGGMCLMRRKRRT